MNTLEVPIHTTVERDTGTIAIRLDAKLLAALLLDAMGVNGHKPNGTKQWTPAQRRKFRATQKRKRAQRALTPTT